VTIGCAGMGEKKKKKRRILSETPGGLKGRVIQSSSGGSSLGNKNERGVPKGVKIPVEK